MYTFTFTRKNRRVELVLVHVLEKRTLSYSAFKRNLQARTFKGNLDSCSQNITHKGKLDFYTCHAHYLSKFRVQYPHMSFYTHRHLTKTWLGPSQSGHWSRPDRDRVRSDRVYRVTDRAWFGHGPRVCPSGRDLTETWSEHGPRVSGH